MDISNRDDNNYYVSNTHNNQENKSSYVKRAIPKVMVSITSPEQLRALEKTDIDNIIVYLFHRGKLINIEAIRNKNIYLKVPNIIREEFENICNII